MSQDTPMNASSLTAPFATAPIDIDALPATVANRPAMPRIDYAALSPEQLGAKLKKLEDQMFQHAHNLEFEDAARVRDEIKKIKAQGLLA